MIFRVLTVIRGAIEAQIWVRVAVDSKYLDCGDSTGSASMANINRIWGKAYLINANVESMQRSSQSTPKANLNAEMAFKLAQKINDDLFVAVSNKRNRDTYFNEIGGLKPPKVLGPDAAVTSKRSSWSGTAMVDRGQESNIVLADQSLPKGVQLDSVKIGKKSFIRGYTPIEANHHKFCLATFRVNELPHLISDRYFMDNRSDRVPIDGMPKVIPNAFQQTGAR